MEPEVIKLLLDKQTELLTEKIDSTVKGIEERVEKQHEALLGELKTGFPNGDLPSHKAAHEVMIKDAKWRDDLKVDAQKKILLGGIGAIFTGLGYLVVDFFKSHSK